MKSNKIITQKIFLLSLVSLFTDMASEMLYPIIPLYLKEIGFTIIWIGFLEGLAEAIAGISKGYFGVWSDNLGKRMPFVRFGYGLSAVSKPMMALFSNSGWIIFSRSTDRIGKGIRTGARDAILSSETNANNKATVFGFHRSMDTIGAVLGPLFALLYLHYFPSNYKPLFYFAFIPGLLAVLLTFIIQEKKNSQSSNKKFPSFKSWFSFYKNSSKDYKKLVGILLLFALFNSSDFFLLLKIKETGLSDLQVIWVYLFYNILYVLFAYPIGKLADKWGIKNIFLIGVICFFIVYLFIGFTNNILLLSLLFCLYAMYISCTEGIAKAWISNISSEKNQASAIGTFAGFQSIATMFASIIAGFIWFKFGSLFTFLLTAFITLIVIVYIHFKIQSNASTT